MVKVVLKVVLLVEIEKFAGAVTATLPDDKLIPDKVKFDEALFAPAAVFAKVGREPALGVSVGAEETIPDKATV